jgi:hypothetical protein
MTSGLPLAIDAKMTQIHNQLKPLPLCETPKPPIAQSTAGT